jgi:arabinofuranan 3-O-arabinosyltransferase
VQVSEVVIPGVRSIVTPAVSFQLPCGLGPRLTVNGQSVPTGVSGTFADLLNGTPVQFTACLAVTLGAGTSQVTEPASDAFDVQEVVLNRTGASGAASVPGAGGAAPAAATVLSWTSSARTLRVAAPTRSYLEVNENFNAGWHAVIAGRPLQPVQLDGWKQAWVLPAGTAGVVTLTYQPSQVYRAAVIGGLIALALVIVAALAMPRRRAGERTLWPADLAGRSRPQLWPDQRRRRWLAAGILTGCLAAAGLVLGGYPGALLVPAVAGALCVPAPGRRVLSDPRLLSGFFVVALVAGAIGQHLISAGHAGPLVSATANAIQQISCLVVVGGLAAALLEPGE